MRQMSTVMDVNLSKSFDIFGHLILLDKIAKRDEDPRAMHLIKRVLMAAGKIWVPQGSQFSPRVANI